MKESVIDILMYLFSNYGDQNEYLPEDRSGVSADLKAAGFDTLEIDKAFEWLAELADATGIPPVHQSPSSLRVFAAQESHRLTQEAQGFIYSLEQSGVLTAQLREMVINRVMALDSDIEVDLEALKWVVMMVLFNSTDHYDADTLMHYEDIVFAYQPAIFH